MTPQQKLLQVGIAQELRKRSTTAALSHITLVTISLFTTELGADKQSPTYLFAITIIFLNFIRLIVVQMRRIKDDLKWLRLYTIFTAINGLCWFAFIYALFSQFGLNNPLSILCFFIMGGVISASLFTLGPSLLNYTIFSSLITAAPLLYIYLSNQMHGPYLAISMISILFLIFIFKQRSILYQDWSRLYLYQKEVQDLINSFPGTISIIREERYSLMSRKIEELTGLKADEIIGKKIGSINPDTDFSRAVLMFIKSESAEMTREISLETKMGIRRYLLSMNKIPSKIDEIVVVLVDIQDLKDAQAQIESQKVSLQAASKMAALGEMSSGLAHEINNPLSIIVGRIGQLEHMMNSAKPFDIERAKEVVRNIAITSERITNIIRGLKNFARDASLDNYDYVTINEIINDTLPFCEERLRNQNIKLTIHLSSPDLKIRCRKTQISQVLLNLLNNSHDAISELPEKWIHIQVDEQPNKAILSVTDSGSGIPEKVREKMMQPFFTTKEVGKGTGLGLSISKGIIEAHLGKFYFDHTNPNTKAVIELPKDFKSN